MLAGRERHERLLAEAAGHRTRKLARLQRRTLAARLNDNVADALILAGERLRSRGDAAEEGTEEAA
jgi:hypothetical protein